MSESQVKRVQKRTISSGDIRRGIIVGHIHTKGEPIALIIWDDLRHRGPVSDTMTSNSRYSYTVIDAAQ